MQFLPFVQSDGFGWMMRGSWDTFLTLYTPFPQISIIMQGVVLHTQPLLLNYCNTALQPSPEGKSHFYDTCTKHLFHTSPTLDFSLAKFTLVINQLIGDSIASRYKLLNKVYSFYIRNTARLYINKLCRLTFPTQLDAQF